jgi:hypothetical protein
LPILSPAIGVKYAGVPFIVIILWQYNF